MSWFDHVIAAVSPSAALKRQVARRRLDRLASLKSPRTTGDHIRSTFDAASGNRLYYDLLGVSQSADSAITGDLRTLRQRVRKLEYNNGFVAGPIQRIVNNVVGMGIRFQSRVKPDDQGLKDVPFPSILEQDAARFNASMERIYKRWSHEADKRMIFSFTEIQRMAESTLLRDGGCLVIGRESSRTSRSIPYCLEVLEIDRLASPMEESSNPSVRNGIRYDAEGVPEAYYVLRRHPGDTLTMTFKNADYEEIPAWYPNGTRKVIHLFNPLRPEQSIGFSAFGAALKDLSDLDRYREAEIFAALEDACLTGFVKTPSPETFQPGYAPNTQEDSDGNVNRIHEFAPNKWHYLNPGEDVYIHAPQRPNAAFGEMTNQLLSGPANTLDIPPEILTQQWRGMNYSNARVALLMFYLSCRVRQQYLIEHLCMPVYESLAMQAIAKGLVTARGFDRRRDDWLAHAWIPPGWQWVDPVKESQGKAIELESNMETLSDIHASKGEDFEEAMDRRARELAYMKKLEEKYGIAFPTNVKTNATADADMDDDDTDRGADTPPHIQRIK